MIKSNFSWEVRVVSLGNVDYVQLNFVGWKLFVL